MCDPRQEGDDHAEGHPAGEENPGGEGLGRPPLTLYEEKQKKNKKKFGVLLNPPKRRVQCLLDDVGMCLVG